MNSRALVAALLVPITGIAAYYIGKEFIRADHYQLYWLGVPIALVIVGSVLLSFKLTAKPGISWFIGFGIGWFVSLVIMFSSLLAYDTEYFSNLPGAADTVGFIELIFFFLVMSLLHFGWVPFLVLFVVISSLNRKT